MKLKKWLQMTDIIGATVIIYNEDEWKLYEGSTLSVPYWVADLHLITKEENEGEPPISFRNSLGKEYDNKPGFVITVKED